MDSAIKHGVDVVLEDVMDDLFLLRIVEEAVGSPQVVDMLKNP
jgi:hypothetical protein